MYEMIELLYIVVILFQGYCLQYFFGNFLESRWKSRWNGVCVALLYAAGLYGISRIVFCHSPPTDKETICKLVLSLCVLFALAMCFYKAFHPITIFLVAAFLAVADISRYSAVILLDIVGNWIFDAWNWCVENGVFKSVKALNVTIMAGIFVVQCLRYLMMVLLLYLSLKKIVRDFREKDYEIRRTELLFLLTPAAVGLFICVLLRIILVTIEDNVQEMLYDRYPMLTILIPAILLLSLLSILYGVKLFQDMICRNKEKSERVILKNQVSRMQEHM